MKKIKAQPLTRENFAQYGSAVCLDGSYKPDGQSDIQTYYGKLALMACEPSVQIGICVAKNRAYIVDELEQHADSSELLAALKGDFVTPVTGSIERDGKMVPDMDNIEAVRVNQGEGVVFEAGMWHWTPYAVTDTCDVLVIFKTDTPDNDFIAHKLNEAITIEV